MEPISISVENIQSTYITVIHSNLDHHPTNPINNACYNDHSSFYNQYKSRFQSSNNLIKNKNGR